MRSSDIWLGLPYDFFSFSMYANVIASLVGLPLGPITFNLGSSHLYQRNLVQAELVLSNDLQLGQIVSPRLPSAPPCYLNQELIHGEFAPVVFGPGCSPEPWGKYLRVLQASTRAEARYQLIEP